jgi:membrane protein DedA with SNARE-associated domain
MEDLLPLLIQYGYIILFLGMIVDAVGLPFPGDLFLLAAGYLASQGAMSVALAIPVAAGAVVVGDSVTFGLGSAVCRREGTFLYRLYCRWTQCTLSSQDCFHRVCNVFSTFGKKSIILSKFMWGTRELIPPLAGLSGMNYKLFIVLDLLGVVLWVVSFLLAGYFLGSQAEAVFGQVQDVALNAALIVAVGMGVILGIRSIKRKRHGRLEPTTEVPIDVRNVVLHDATKAGSTSTQT